MIWFEVGRAGCQEQGLCRQEVRRHDRAVVGIGHHRIKLFLFEVPDSNGALRPDRRLRPVSGAHTPSV